MVRPRKDRKSRYRSYYEKDGDDSKIPESTLRYVRGKAATGVDESSTSDSSEGSSDVDGSSSDGDQRIPSDGNSDLEDCPTNAEQHNLSQKGNRFNVIEGAVDACEQELDQDDQQPIASQPPESPDPEDDEDGPANGQDGYRAQTPIFSEESVSSCSSQSSSESGNEDSSLNESSGSSLRLHSDDEEQISDTSDESDNTDEDAIMPEDPADVHDPGQEGDALGDDEVQDQVDDAVDLDADDPFDQPDKDPFQKLKSNTEKMINIEVTVTLGEVLTNFLRLARKHNISHLEKENIMKFINSILNCGDILPTSRYLLDEFFYSKKDMIYHFYCAKCTSLVGSIPACNPRPDFARCSDPECNEENILGDLSKASYFVTFDVPSQVELILSDPNVRKHLINPIDVANYPRPDFLRDIYDGSQYRKFATRIRTMRLPQGAKIISYTLSVDSASICQFSGVKICPCYLLINELPPVLRVKHLILVGLWFGKTKEKIDLFLPPIVKHISDLSKGFRIDVGNEKWVLVSYLICCCADSVARCEIQGIHAHRGEFPCSWCLVEGEEFERKRIFPFDKYPSEPRTIQELLEDSRNALLTKTIINGVKYLSPLAAAPLFHPVDGFLVDPMHSTDEGTSKSFLSAWLHRSGEDFYIGTPTNIDKIENALKTLKPPLEFRKAVRKLEHLSYWTARELQIYVSVPALDKILPNRYLKHYSLYVQATYILMFDGVPIEALQIAKVLLEEFCSKTATFYGSGMMLFNLHILLHLVMNCLRWGPTFALNAYGFEAGNQFLKKLIQNCNGIPSQICRGFSEYKALNFLSKHCSTNMTNNFKETIDRKQTATKFTPVGEVKLVGFSKPFKPSREERFLINGLGHRAEAFTQYRGLVKSGCFYESLALQDKKKRSDNSYARLTDHSIIVIRKILYNCHSEEVLIAASKVRSSPSAYCPREVIRNHPQLCFQYIVNSIDVDVELFSAAQLKMICCSFKLPHGHFISPMPNVFNLY